MGQRGKRDDRLVIPLVWLALNRPRTAPAGLAIMVALWAAGLPDMLVAHRLLVPALGLIVGVRVWWPPAEAPEPDRQARPRPARPVRPQAAIGKPAVAAA